jgi:hypothetical protein
LSKEECEYSYNNPADVSEGKPTLAILQTIGAAVTDGISQGLGASKLSAGRMELHTAVVELIRNPQLMQRWRNRRPLLKNSSDATSG